MIVLRSAGLLVRVDEQRGGEILDLVDTRSGRQLLAQMPFSTRVPRAADVPEGEWLDGHRGGWQFLSPNAGNASTYEDVYHGFHGASSRSRWDIVSQADGSIELRWRGHGLEITRSLSLTDDTLGIRTDWTAEDRPAPLIAVEHIAVGPEVLDPQVEVWLPGGNAFETSETEGPPTPLEDGCEWPETRLLDGSKETANLADITNERSRFMVVADLPEGRAEIRNTATGCGLRLLWDHSFLPHTWIWHEVRASGGPWHQAAQLLMVEPASVPHSLGLKAAVEHGQAIWARPGARSGYTITAEVLS